MTVAMVEQLESVLGHSFGNKDLLEEALIHPSLLGTSQKTAKRHDRGYERLEFLGDRVLGLIIAELLVSTFPDESEGDLARRHAALVKGKTLAKAARQMKLGDFMKLSVGERNAGGQNNPAILADVFEALCAAVYLDGGLDAARRMLNQHLAPLLVTTEKPPVDSKTRLQEWTQGKFTELPKYRTLSESGPAHAPEFEVEVTVPGHDPICAKGTSKRAAEKAAALAMLGALGLPTD
ncbi:MAG: ribonuclease III [Alphaproteobacteria bacterium]